MNTSANEDWFDIIRNASGERVRISKFLNDSYIFSVERLKILWPSWDADTRASFAAAFAAKPPLSDNDQTLLEFLMENGNARIWRTIALSLTRHRDRNRAIAFLLRRISEDVPPLANYYQALGALKAAESIPILKRAFVDYDLRMDRHRTLDAWGDRLSYFDRLWCSATLFGLTGDEEYRTSVRMALEHSDEAVRKMGRAVANTIGIKIDQ